MAKMDELMHIDTRRLSPEEELRLFEHAKHEEGVFYNRLNVFLLVETVLLATAIGAVKDAAAGPVIFIINVFGILMSVFWWFSQANKLILVKTLETRLENRFEEFRETIAFADKYRIHKKSSNTIFAHVFPWLFAGVWVVLLLWQWVGFCDTGSSNTCWCF